LPILSRLLLARAAMCDNRRDHHQQESNMTITHMRLTPILPPSREPANPTQ
jgi:hypothetical protein